MQGEKMMNELETLREFNFQLQNHFNIQYERIRKLEEAIRNHQSEMQNLWSNLSIDDRQIPDWDINKKLWDCL
jgi:hypothetical protein